VCPDRSCATKLGDPDNERNGLRGKLSLDRSIENPDCSRGSKLREPEKIGLEWIVRSRETCRSSSEHAIFLSSRTLLFFFT